jgi:hypothetical protein
MKYLIIPDVHNRWEKAEELIKKVPADKIIFLGDFFDDFNDTPQDIAETAGWFHDSVNKPDRIHICGNHDLHYWFKDNKFLQCSGYEQYKSITINDFVTKEDWEKLVFHYVLDGQFLLSHGGVAPFWLNPHNFNPMEISEYNLNFVDNRLKRESIEAKKQFYRNQVHWFGMPGHSRSYNAPFYGGITWLDWNKEFHPIRGIHQIVGHTPNYNLSWTIVKDGETSPLWQLPLDVIGSPILTDKSSFNVCLDSQPGSRYYAVYEDKRLIIKLV